MASHVPSEIVDITVLPLLGLDEDFPTYPFVDLWGLPHASLARKRGMATAFPENDQVFAQFRTYRDVAHVVFPGTGPLPRLESEVMEFLLARAAANAKALLAPITDTGEPLLRDLTHRVRAFRNVFKTWEELHIDPNDGKMAAD